MNTAYEMIEKIIQSKDLMLSDDEVIRATLRLLCAQVELDLEYEKKLQANKE